LGFDQAMPTMRLLQLMVRFQALPAAHPALLPQFRLQAQSDQHPRHGSHGCFLPMPA